MSAPAALEAKSLFICVGDKSADKPTSRLIKSLKEQAPQVTVFGMGGPAMMAEGFESARNINDFAQVGVVEIWLKVRFYMRLKDELVQSVLDRKPDAVLFVDYGGMNLRLAKELRKRFPKLPLLYFISPQVWASRPWRIKTVAENITKMLVLFPFEEQFYAERGVEAQFVGHHLLRDLPALESVKDKAGFCAHLNADPEKFLIGVFPGSRKKEIMDFFPVVLQSIRTLLAQRSDVQFAISIADNKLAQLVEKRLQSSDIAAELGKHMFLIPSQDNYRLMANSDLVWAKSGTTTLEVTLFAAPMIIFYRALWISFTLFLLVKTVKRVGLPNILAGEELVPELLQLDCRAESFVRYTNDLLDVPALRQEISRKLKSLRDQLGEGDYVKSTVAEILKVLY